MGGCLHPPRSPPTSAPSPKGNPSHEYNSARAHCTSSASNLHRVHSSRARHVICTDPRPGGVRRRRETSRHRLPGRLHLWNPLCRMQRGVRPRRGDRPATDKDAPRRTRSRSPTQVIHNADRGRIRGLIRAHSTNSPAWQLVPEHPSGRPPARCMLSANRRYRRENERRTAWRRR